MAGRLAGRLPRIGEGEEPQRDEPAAGRPLALALADMGIEVGEAACCVLLAWAVWRDPEGT
jgi:hypothetical protein